VGRAPLSGQSVPFMTAFFRWEAVKSQHTPGVKNRQTSGIRRAQGNCSAVVAARTSPRADGGPPGPAIRTGVHTRFRVCNKAMNVLVLNLTRFGDLIQTQPVVSGLADSGCRVGLLCLDNFLPAADLLRDVSWKKGFPGSRLLAALDRDWRVAVAGFDDLRRCVQTEFAPHRIVNLTPSLPARLLARALAPAPDAVQGFGIDEFGFNADTSSWAAFLQLASGHRGASPFNVVDLFRRAADLRHVSPRFALRLPDAAGPKALTLPPEAEALFAAGAEQGETARGWLGVQLGASEDRRRWPVEHFARAARLFYQEQGMVPVLFGTSSEKELARRFAAAYDGPLVDLTGRTTLPQLAVILCRLHLLLTNDTGTMHLAAGLGVPVAAVFLATAQPFDTGPYHAGSLCFEPDMNCHPCAFGADCPHGQACRSAIPPETVHAAAAACLAGEPMPPLSGARVWRSVVGDDGLMDLESLSGHDSEDRTRWIRLQRAVYRRFFDGELGDGESVSGLEGLSREKGQRLREVLTEAHELLFLMERQAEVLAARPLPVMQTKFLATCQRLGTTLSSEHHLEVLGLMWNFESQSKGDRLDRLVALVQEYRRLMRALLAVLR